MGEERDPEDPTWVSKLPVNPEATPGTRGQSIQGRNPIKRDRDPNAPLNPAGQRLVQAPPIRDVAVGWQAQGLPQKFNETMVQIERLLKQESSAPPLPFHVTKVMDGEILKLAVAGGAWQEGATGPWQTMAPTEAAAGNKAYLVIEQDENRDIVEDGVSIVVTSDVLDPIVIVPAADPDPETATSNVLLAEFPIEVEELVQRRHGNFTLGLWQIDGDVARWPETLVGTIPPPEPEVPL
jgi:hypothetical protein